MQSIAELLAKLKLFLRTEVLYIVLSTTLFSEPSSMLPQNKYWINVWQMNGTWIGWGFNLSLPSFKPVITIVLYCLIVFLFTGHQWQGIQLWAIISNDYKRIFVFFIRRHINDRETIEWTGEVDYYRDLILVNIL